MNDELLHDRFTAVTAAEQLAEKHEQALTYAV